MRFLDKILALFEGVVIALDAIRANKVRAGLTILGIAVGVFVVTVMSAAVHGINAGVTKSIAAAGPTTFFITKWPGDLQTCNGSADSCPWRRYPPLTIELARRIEALSDIKYAVAQVGSSTPVSYLDRDLPGVGMAAFTPGWLETEGGDLVAGRDFTAQENAAAAPVAIINTKLKERLFDDSDPIGKLVRLGGQQFTIIGVYEPIATAFDAGDKGRLVVPFESARRKLGVGVRWMQITVKPKEGVARDVAMDEVLTLLRSERRLRPAEKNDFFINTPEKILEIYNKFVGAFFLVMLVLSAIGLIVGGVGVVAIMMISVTERTREIGVRKALGATKAIVLWQFLVEAATLTTIGAIVGLVGGAGVAALIRNLSPIDASIPPTAVVLALGASALTGILFGMLPAARAARLDPVEALRYE